MGKLAGFHRAMKGGIGSAAVRMPDGLIVGAIVAANSLGDIVDPSSGRVVAGVRTTDGDRFADARAMIRQGMPLAARRGSNTTIGVVATNRALTKSQATKVAQMAHDGYARAIYPVHTPADGDTVFAVSTATEHGEVDLVRLGALAAQVTADAVVRAAKQAQSLPGYPAARDISE